MKKIMVVVLALSLVLGLGAFALAAAGNPENGVSAEIPVKAVVGKYAKVVELGCGGLSFNFEGRANETDQAQTDVEIESNCSIDVQLSATVLTFNGGNDTIAVDYDFGGYKFKGGQSTSFTRTGAAYGKYILSGTAKLGAISAQSAGNYSAKVTITVSAL